MAQEATTHWPLARNFTLNYARLATAFLEACDMSPLPVQVTTTDFARTSIDIPRMRIYVIPGATERFVAVVVHDGTQPTGTWRKPVLVTNEYRAQHGRGPAPDGSWPEVLGVDVVFKADGKVYATPAGATALPFLNKLATGGITREISKLFNHCLLCGRQLTNKGSLEQLHGPVCAQRINTYNTICTLSQSEASVARNTRLEPRHVDWSEVVMDELLDEPRLREAMVQTVCRLTQASEVVMGDATASAEPPLVVLAGSSSGFNSCSLSRSMDDLVVSLTGFPRVDDLNDDQANVLRVTKQALYEANLLLQDAMYIPRNPANVLSMMGYLQLHTREYHMLMCTLDDMLKLRAGTAAHSRFVARRMDIA